MTITPDQRKTLAAAISKYGNVHHILMLIEEMGELQDAICKYTRSRAEAADIHTEIADVMIMCEQMAIIFGASEVQQQIDYKIDRLKKRIEEQ